MPKGNVKIAAQNRRARHEYFIEETLEVGLVLTGTEVKSLRDGRASLQEGYAAIWDGELWLENVNISPYPYARYDNHEPKRRRKLLAHARQIKQLTGKTAERGFSLIPLCIYFRDGKAKLELGLAKGKKNIDKRQALKERQASREIDRAYRRGE